MTRIKPIFNDIVARRTWKRVRHGEDGEEHENKCEGFGDSEVHVCVIDLLVVETENLYVQVRLQVLALYIGLSTESGMDIASAGGQCPTAPEQCCATLTIYFIGL